MILLQDLSPINKEKEKEKFFFDANYNPQFVYAQRIREEDLQRFGAVSDEYLKQATNIVDTVIKKWGTESAFLAQAEGELLSKEQVANITRDYIQKNGLEGKVKIRFVEGQVSPCSMSGDVISFRLPIAQRALRLEGTLNHEIGTHYFRRINEEKQPWVHEHPKFGLHPHIETEEGLAALHSLLLLEHKNAWFDALYYVAVYNANQMSFSELYQYLKKYIDDRNRRWNITLRAKRGISDTSKPGAIAKDQVYLRGMVQVLQWLEKNDYNPAPLYYGKIAIEDLDLVGKINPNYSPIIPTFLNIEMYEAYASAVKDLKKQNALGK